LRSAGYELWVDKARYFDPAQLQPKETTDTRFWDYGAAGSAGSEFYAMRGLSACGGPSGLSPRKGEFTFELKAAT
jgi:hypothetical protein